MSNYLQIAETVLAQARRPLGPRSILEMAYRADIVPHELYGETQHKTLQARLSEDILHNRERSLFFRTAPGKFFLRKFISDPSIPKSYRREMIARRRSRDLMRGPALCIEAPDWSLDVKTPMVLEPGELLSKLHAQARYRYVEPRAVTDDCALVWSAATVRRDKHILVYRTGRYRDDRDSFAHKKSICFAGLVAESDRTLFDWLGLGIIESALNAVSTDLNVPIDRHFDPDGHCEDFQHRLACVVWARSDRRPEYLAMVDVEAPDWFEPAQTRLSINDLHWMSLENRPNNMEDFDPWSRSLLEGWFFAHNEAVRRSPEVHTAT